MLAVFVYYMYIYILNVVYKLRILSRYVLCLLQDWRLSIGYNNNMPQLGWITVFIKL